MGVGPVRVMLLQPRLRQRLCRLGKRSPRPAALEVKGRSGQARQGALACRIGRPAYPGWPGLGGRGSGGSIRRATRFALAAGPEGVGQLGQREDALACVALDLLLPQPPYQTGGGCPSRTACSWHRWRNSHTWQWSLRTIRGGAASPICCTSRRSRSASRWLELRRTVVDRHPSPHQTTPLPGVRPWMRGIGAGRRCRARAVAPAELERPSWNSIGT